MNFNEALQCLIIKIMHGVTYLIAGTSALISFLNQYAGGIGVLIAFLTYLTSAWLNNHWQKKRYDLEAMKMKMEKQDGAG